MNRSWLLVGGVLSGMLLAGQSMPKNANKAASTMCCAMCNKSAAQGEKMGCCTQMKGASAGDITSALEAKKTELQLTSDQISQVAEVLAGEAGSKGGCCHKMEHSHGAGGQ